MHGTKSRTDSYKTIVLGILLGLGIVSSDLYVSILPRFSHVLEITPLESSLTIAFFLGTTAIGTILFLPLRCFFSLKSINTLALLLFSSAFVFLYLLEGFTGLLGCRVTQGIAYGIIQSTLLATAKISFHANAEAKFARMAFVSEVLCLAAPLSGLALTNFFGWQYPFIFISLLALGLSFFSSPAFPLEKNDQKLDFKAFHGVFRSKQYMGWLSITAVQSGLAWGIIALTPFVFKMHGWDDLFICVVYSFYSVFYAAGCYLSEKLPISSERLLQSVYLSPIVVVPLLLAGIIFELSFAWAIGFLIYGFFVALSFGIVMARCSGAVPDSYNGHVGFLTAFCRLMSSGLFVFFVALFFSFGKITGAFFVCFMVCLSGLNVFLMERSYKKSMGMEEPEPVPMPMKKAGNM